MTCSSHRPSPTRRSSTIRPILALLLAATLGATFLSRGGEQSWNQLNVESNAASTATSSVLRATMPDARHAEIGTSEGVALQKQPVLQRAWDSITSSRPYTTEDKADMGGGIQPAPLTAALVVASRYALLTTACRSTQRRRLLWRRNPRGRARVAAILWTVSRWDIRSHDERCSRYGSVLLATCVALLPASIVGRTRPVRHLRCHEVPHQTKSCRWKEKRSKQADSKMRRHRHSCATETRKGQGSLWLATEDNQTSIPITPLPASMRPDRWTTQHAGVVAGGPN